MQGRYAALAGYCSGNPALAQFPVLSGVSLVPQNTTFRQNAVLTGTEKR
jgi:hypothetical protein